MVVCQHGNLMDERGCKTANCNPAPNTDTKPECPPVFSMVVCQHGNLMDERGCKTANCNPAPNADTKDPDALDADVGDEVPEVDGETPADTKPECPPVLSMVVCQHGNL